MNIVCQTNDFNFFLLSFLIHHVIQIKKNNYSTTLNNIFSITYYLNYTMLYIFTIIVKIDQVKILMFYNIQITNLIVVGKEMR